MTTPATVTGPLDSLSRPMTMSADEWRRWVDHVAGLPAVDYPDALRVLLFAAVRRAAYGDARALPLAADLNGLLARHCFLHEGEDAAAVADYLLTLPAEKR